MTTAVLASIGALVWWTGASATAVPPVAPSEVRSERPRGLVKVEGVIVSSESDDRGFTALVADHAAPEVGVLRIVYRGKSPSSLGRGVWFIATGRLNPLGELIVDDLVLRGSGGYIQ